MFVFKILFTLIFSIGFSQQFGWVDNGLALRQGVHIEWQKTGDIGNNGEMIFAWSDTRTSDREVYAQKFDSEGNKLWGNEGIIVVEYEGRQEDPILINDGNGGAYLIWRDYRDENYYGDIYVGEFSNGLKDGEWELEKSALKDIIQNYTKEAGVRNLEREISKVARKTVKNILTNKIEKVKIDSKNLIDYLGVKKFKNNEMESDNKVGVVTGLAWTEFGGEILKIETVNMPGKGRMQITGKLGDVMQESVKAAKSFVRSKCLEYGIIPPLFEKKDFHIHVPEGATPKDGPSAGIAMVTSIVSSITTIPVRKDVAMTGEVTLTGQVLPIGGLKEKLLAAHRAGIKEVLIPKENEKDLVDMPKKIIDEIKITPVEYADEVLKIALTKELKKTEWVEVDLTKKDDKSQASIQ